MVIGSFIILIFLVTFVFTLDLENSDGSQNLGSNSQREHSELILNITPQPGTALCPVLEDLQDYSVDDMFDVAPISGGLGYGMTATDITGAETVGINTFRVTPANPITGVFHLYYPDTPENADPVDLLYIVILNEQQITAFGDETSTSQDIHLRPGERTNLDLHIPPLDPGIHDLIVLGLVVTPPANHGGVVALAYRATLITDDDPTPSMQTYVNLSPDSIKTDDETVFNVSLHTDRSQHVWVWPETHNQATDDSLEYYISVGYSESAARLREHGITPQPQPLALLAFVEGEQVSIAQNEMVFYGTVTPNNLYSFVPASLNVAQYTDQVALLVVRINYPRIPMCWLTGTKESYQFDARVYAVQVGVEVIEP